MVSGSMPNRPRGALLIRLAGLFILLIVPLLIASVFLDPGLETRPEYFAESFARFVPQRERYLVSAILMFAAAFVALAAGCALFLRFRPLGMDLATAGALGLLVAGFLVLGAAGAGLRVYQLATEWLTLTGTGAGQAERSALAVQQLRFLSAGLGYVLLLVSLICCGVVFHRSTRLPRWLLSLPVVSGIIIVASPLGFLSVGIFLFLMVSAVLLFVWLTAETGWLLIRGTATTSLDTRHPTP